MVLALLIRLARSTLNRITKLIANMQLSQPSQPVVWALDPDLLTEELKNPAFRQFYMDHLENCLAMPSRQRR